MSKQEVFEYLEWVKSQMDDLVQRISLYNPNDLAWDDLLVVVRTTQMNEESMAYIRDNLDDYKLPWSW